MVGTTEKSTKAVLASKLGQRVGGLLGLLGGLRGLSGLGRLGRLSRSGLVVAHVTAARDGVSGEIKGWLNAGILGTGDGVRDIAHHITLVALALGLWLMLALVCDNARKNLRCRWSDRAADQSGRGEAWSGACRAGGLSRCPSPPCRPCRSCHSSCRPCPASPVSGTFLLWSTIFNTYTTQKLANDGQVTQTAGQRTTAILTTVLSQILAPVLTFILTIVLAIVLAKVLPVILALILAFVLTLILVRVLIGILTGILALILTFVLAIILAPVLTRLPVLVSLSTTFLKATSATHLTSQAIHIGNIVQRTATDQVASLVAVAALARSRRILSRALLVTFVLILRLAKILGTKSASTYTTKQPTDNGIVGQVTSERPSLMFAHVTLLLLVLLRHVSIDLRHKS